MCEAIPAFFIIKERPQSDYLTHLGMNELSHLLFIHQNPSLIKVMVTTRIRLDLEAKIKSQLPVFASRKANSNSDHSNSPAIPQNSADFQKLARGRLLSLEG